MLRIVSCLVVASYLIPAAAVVALGDVHKPINTSIDSLENCHEKPCKRVIRNNWQIGQHPFLINPIRLDYACTGSL